LSCHGSLMLWLLCLLIVRITCWTVIAVLFLRPMDRYFCIESGAGEAMGFVCTGTYHCAWTIFYFYLLATRKRNEPLALFIAIFCITNVKSRRGYYATRQCCGSFRCPILGMPLIQQVNFLFFQRFYSSVISMSTCTQKCSSDC